MCIEHIFFYISSHILIIFYYDYWYFQVARSKAPFNKCLNFTFNKL